MKGLSILIGLLGLSFSVFAQSKNSWLKNERYQEHFRKISAFMNASKPARANKPTATRERVIAQVMDDSGYWDSTAYSYSGTRGSRYDFNNPELLYNSELSSEYAPIPRVFESYDPMNMLADTILNYDNNGLYSTTFGAYRPDDKLDSIIVDGGLKVLNSYDANGYLIEQNAFLIDATGAVSDDAFQRKLRYNAGYTQVTGDSLLVDGILELNNMYWYGSDDLVDSVKVYANTGTALELRAMMAMGHDAEGRIIYLRLEEYYGGGGYGMLDSFSYLGNSPVFENWISYYYEDPNTLLEKNHMKRVLNADELTDTLHVHYTDLLTNEQDSVFATYISYTSLNNPEEINIFFDGLPETTLKFYYETYDDGVGVDQVNTSLSLEVFPNPFSRELYISLESESAKTPVDIRLVDIQGRAVYQTALQMRNGSNKLQLPELPEGIYQLILQDTEGKVATQKLVKIK